jgi:DNA-binding CsgD family transcriptional regulator
VALANLADVATLGRNFAEARLLLDEAIQLAEGTADDYVRAFILLNLAENLLGSKDYPGAISRFRASQEYAAVAGTGRLHALALCGLGQALCADGQEAAGRDHLRACEKIAVQMDDHLVLRKAREALKATTATVGTLKLTSRETETIQRVDKGDTDREIADHLGIAVPTVRRHLENIFAKLGVSSRGSAAATWRNLP